MNIDIDKLSGPEHKGARKGYKGGEKAYLHELGIGAKCFFARGESICSTLYFTLITGKKGPENWDGNVLSAGVTNFFYEPIVYQQGTRDESLIFDVLSSTPLFQLL